MSVVGVNIVNSFARCPLLILHCVMLRTVALASCSRHYIFCLSSYFGCCFAIWFLSQAPLSTKMSQFHWMSVVFSAFQLWYSLVILGSKHFLKTWPAGHGNLAILRNLVLCLFRHRGCGRGCSAFTDATAECPSLVERMVYDLAPWW